MNTVRIGENIIIPEPQHPIAFRLDQPSSLRVYFVAVLAAVAFDHQARSVACEIDDEMAKRHLAPEARLGDYGDSLPNALIAARCHKFAIAIGA
jgi:hypothetical protein